MKKLLSKLKSTKGFTLVEMIVVMAIIGVLVALLAPNVATLIKDAQDTSNDAKTKNVMTILSAYNAKHVKDGYQYKGKNDKNFDDVTGNDGTVIKVTAANLNTTVMDLWESDPATTSGGTGTKTTISFAGDSTGYLPAKVLSGTETMYLYLSTEGNVLGVVYVDGNNVVKSANTNLNSKASDISIGAASEGGSAPVISLDSSNVRGMTTSDGLAFSK